MAILNSITIGKGRKSLGNVTLQTLGGVVVAKQKIMRNTSKSVKQQAQRKHFKAVMNQLRKFAGLARAAYSRVKTQSAYARWAKSFYPTAAALTPAQLPTATPISMVQSRLAADEDFMISDGNKVFSGAYVEEAGEGATNMIFELTSGLPGATPFGVGDTIPVEVNYYEEGENSLTTDYASVIVASSSGDPQEDLAVWIIAGKLFIRVRNVWVSGSLAKYPVISINNERLGLPASLLAVGA